MRESGREGFGEQKQRLARGLLLCWEEEPPQALPVELRYGYGLTTDCISHLPFSGQALMWGFLL